MVQTNKENSIEKTKELIEAAMRAGRRLQSSQTGYIHHYYHSQDQDPQQTIPILENALFVLTLFRTRLVDNMNEAKEMLGRLLVFQCQQGAAKGNFPIYLHHYPECLDRYVGILLLAPLYWILKLFGHVLGQELRGKLESSIKEIFSYGLQLEKEIPLPYSIQVRFAAAKMAYGTLFSNSELVNNGTIELKSLCELNHNDSWHMTAYLSDLLIGLQMAYPSIKNSPWATFWKYLERTWHRQTCCYVGPCIKELQKHEEPQITYYDIFMSYFSDQSAGRIKKNNSYINLHGALVQPSDDTIEIFNYPFDLEGTHNSQSWVIFHDNACAVTLLDKKIALNPHLEQTYTPYRFVWGDETCAHSLVCQGGSALIDCHRHKGFVELFFHLDNEIDIEHPTRQKEINFYLDVFPGIQIKVENQATNTFEFGQEIIVHSGGAKLSFSFDLIEGEGQFLGHISRGNRPSQLDLKGENRYNSYDWNLFIRTIRRSNKCLIKARISFEG
ncbi:MAG: hypothetical protein H0W88_10510 [Parachlamydiaceae bacterium]|nr:hypothetical protein [Parachlamydiaceae bacterium]